MARSRAGGLGQGGYSRRQGAPPTELKGRGRWDLLPRGTPPIQPMADGDHPADGGGRPWWCYHDMLLGIHRRTRHRSGCRVSGRHMIRQSPLSPWVSGHQHARPRKKTEILAGRSLARISVCCAYRGPVTRLIPWRPFPSFNRETFTLSFPLSSINQPAGAYPTIRRESYQSPLWTASCRSLRAPGCGSATRTQSRSCT